MAEFGLSKQFAENGKSYFSNSFAGGWLHYVVPLHLLEEKELRKNVDLWSLGVVLYELCLWEKRHLKQAWATVVKQQGLQS